MSQNPRKAKSDTLEYRKTKEQTILVAAELIEEVGYKGLKFDELAARLGCNRATIYRYFDSKKELLESVMRLLMTEVTQKILDSVAGTRKVTVKSFADALYQVIETLSGE
ncbi:MAG: TetR/AcrR family transcriptional regulator, partial [Pseudomonadales bacterium]|nr:TetR/AcrR family transcriptional regulator [Pseudomonadales bacterium]